MKRKRELKIVRYEYRIEHRIKYCSFLLFVIVKQHLKKSVTLDYSVVKKPEYKIDAVDLFLKVQ